MSTDTAKKLCLPSIDFFDLPPEIRIIIYEFSLQQPGWTFIGDISPLCQVNRQIRYEALPLFYRTNDLCLDLRAPHDVHQARLQLWRDWLSISYAKDLRAIMSFHLSFHVVLTDGFPGAPLRANQNKCSVTAEMQISARWFVIRFLGPYSLSMPSWQFLNGAVQDLLISRRTEDWDGKVLLTVAETIMKGAKRLECVPPWSAVGQPPKRFAYVRDDSIAGIETRYCWASYEWGSHCPKAGCVCPERSKTN
ncbi:hypothetical protein NA57DRAFT_79563 [Rhizodiscina lignyota]|uniref:F-box domain-containing protein n=1 Tax=Rhizodiscina lignyota TaxID=1504668 RepID=A0A9P4I4Y9_9PEZI|nr:hypothetical protein NA57DRAFT_79563 [Rhizodiscina lignyota]